MVDFSAGIGSFMGGFAKGQALKQQREDREYKREVDEEDRGYKREQMERWRQQNQRADEDRTRQQELYGIQLEKEKLGLETARGVMNDANEGRGTKLAVKGVYADAMAGAERDKAEAISKSIFPVEVQGPVRPTDTPLPTVGYGTTTTGKQTFQTEAEARTEAGKNIDTMDLYRKNYAPQVAQYLVKNGFIKDADQFNKWINDDRTQAGQRYWADAWRLSEAGDIEGAADNILRSYNVQGYYDNGYQAHAYKVSDDNGNLKGFRLSFVNQKTGDVHDMGVIDPKRFVQGGLFVLEPGNTLKEGVTQWRDANKPAQDLEMKRQEAQIDIEKERQKAQIKSETRPLPSSAINNLASTGEAATNQGRLSDTFKNEYAGQPIAGNAWNWVGRTFGGDSAPQAEWWQDYQSQKNVVRNKLFGSALTAQEKGEFEKADINPGMSPDVIRTNLTRQNAAATRAARKLATAYSSQGYSREVIEGALGIPLGDLGVQAPGATGSATTDAGQPGQGGGRAPHGGGGGMTGRLGANVAPQDRSGSGQAPHEAAAASAQQTQTIIEQARAAIARGAPPSAVADRLRQNGIDPGSLF